MDDVGAAGQPAALAGETGADTTATARGLDSLGEVARVATSSLFGVASVIGVVEVAARQWAVAKAKWTEISRRTNDNRPAPEEQSGAERDARL